MVDERLLGQPRGIMHLLHVPLLVIHVIGNVGHRGYHVHVEFAVEPLLNDFHVEQSEEAASEAEAQSDRTLRRERQ